MKETPLIREAGIVDRAVIFHLQCASVVIFAFRYV
jgi:hypothetical protein